MKTARTKQASVSLRKADFAAPHPPWRAAGFATGIFRLLCAGIALAAAASSSTAAVLFSDDFSTATSADYASGGIAAGGGGPGTLTIPGDGIATFAAPNGGFGSYFGFGRALGQNVLTASGPDILTVSMTFSFNLLNSTVGVLALYAGNGTSATVSQSPYNTNMPALGTQFAPAGGLDAAGLQNIGNTGATASVITYTGSTVYGDAATLASLSINTDYTMVMTITREPDFLATPTYTVATTLNGTPLSGALVIGDLGAINQVGLRWFESGAPSTGFDTPTIISINEFSAAIVPEPATSALVVVGAAACALMMGRRLRTASRK